MYIGAVDVIIYVTTRTVIKPIRLSFHRAAIDSSARIMGSDVQSSNHGSSSLLSKVLPSASRKERMNEDPLCSGVRRCAGTTKGGRSNESRNAWIYNSRGAIPEEYGSEERMEVR